MSRTPLDEALALIDLMLVTGDRSLCWPWPHGKDSNGYGRVYGGQVLVSHLVLEQDGRPRPTAPGDHALHSCDNPPCFNPAHLSWGTNKRNAGEREERGLGGGDKRRGERNGRAKLTDAQRQAIRDEHVPGYGNSKALMQKYGISQPTFNRVLRGK
ncbi:hypothetical protein [Streptomyces sp. NBC_00425]|uniref:hypothetical protein n=1 Tax=Streptomyces sp. NBC_00425 TaxID=2975740 RepID=UPI002E21C622